MDEDCLPGLVCGNKNCEDFHEGFHDFGKQVDCCYRVSRVY